MDAFVSKHFTLERIADGIFAAIAKDDGGAMSNAGFVDLGDQTIVFDAFQTQQAAEDLKAVAESITKKPVSWVINSHWHGDHIRGNQVYKGANILSSAKTYETMKTNHPERIKGQQADLEGLNQYIESLENKLANAVDTAEKEDLKNQLGFLGELKLSLPHLELVLPNYTYNREFTFYGSERTAVLKTRGAGHSTCDAFLYLPEDKVVFMGDLLFVDNHPVLFEESDPMNWMSTLNEIKALDANVFIPGHGHIGEKDNLDTVSNYINHILEMVKGDASEEVAIPVEYQSWKMPDSYQRNIKRLKDK